MKNKQYYKILPLEQWANKLYEYLTKVINSDTAMYDKTIDKYKKLRDDLYECSILADRIVSKNLEVTDSEVQTSKPTNNISDIIVRIDTCLYSLCRADLKYEQIYQCAEMLHLWFHSRFNGNDAEFKYNISYLSNWICNFIILFGKYNHDGNIDKFCNMIKSWCDKLPSNHTYAVPYDIYKLNTLQDPTYFTIDAVIIYDILYNSGLIQLSSENFDCGINLEYDSVLKIVKNNNEYIKDKIALRISKRTELINEIGLKLIGGDN